MNATPTGVGIDATNDPVVAIARLHAAIQQLPADPVAMSRHLRHHGVRGHCMDEDATALEMFLCARVGATVIVHPARITISDEDWNYAALLPEKLKPFIAAYEADAYPWLIGPCSTGTTKTIGVHVVVVE